LKTFQRTEIEDPLRKRRRRRRRKRKRKKRMFL
jgi:hypothetical protein